MEKTYDVAVVGATGLVGGKIIELLENRRFPIRNLRAFARNEHTIAFRGEDLRVMPLTGENVIKNRADIALFSAGSQTAKQFAPLFSALGCVVIDNSSAFRSDDEVPLIVPEVNGAYALINNGIIANPNCSTIQSVVALAPLHKRYGLKRIVYNTYQAVSGAGNDALENFRSQIDDYVAGKETDLPEEKRFFPNVIPQIGAILSDGYTEEEHKMIAETKKILGDDSIAVTATTARVPVFIGHCVAINFQLNYSAGLSDVTRTLKESGLNVADVYTPLQAAGKDEVTVSRLRRDHSAPNSFCMWVTADNLLKGAALNAVQIAELLI